MGELASVTIILATVILYVDTRTLLQGSLKCATLFDHPQYIPHCTLGYSKCGYPRTTEHDPNYTINVATGQYVVGYLYPLNGHWSFQPQTWNERDLYYISWNDVLIVLVGISRNPFANLSYHPEFPEIYQSILFI